MYYRGIILKITLDSAVALRGQTSDRLASSLHCGVAWHACLSVVSATHPRWDAAAWHQVDFTVLRGVRVGVHVLLHKSYSRSVCDSLCCPQ
jgi:hypothetical protein